MKIFRNFIVLILCLFSVTTFAKQLVYSSGITPVKAYVTKNTQTVIQLKNKKMSIVSYSTEDLDAIVLEKEGLIMVRPKINNKINMLLQSKTGKNHVITLIPTDKHTDMIEIIEILPKKTIRKIKQK